MSETIIDGYVGKNVFVRTVTHHYTGKLTEADDRFLKLADAAWIADDGRFTQALADGDLNEVEPFPGEALIGAGSVIDLCEWLHTLPREQK